MKQVWPKTAFTYYYIKKLFSYVSSIAQEILQNADDARALTVKFFLDCRQHGTTNLIEPALAQFQGPALLAYNDAAFSADDWEGIQSLQQSIKADDPFKVGKFGIGFTSVYHITGEYMYTYQVMSIIKILAGA